MGTESRTEVTGDEGEEGLGGGQYLMHTEFQHGLMKPFGTQLSNIANVLLATELYT